MSEVVFELLIPKRPVSLQAADNLPFLLQKPFLDNSECVYVRISKAKNLEEYL